MKKLLAMLMLGAFLVPGTAHATYSCFGTRSPCDLTGGIKVSALEKPAPVKQKKKKAVKHKKHVVKHHAKKKAKPKTYCYPEPRAKVDDSLVKDLPKQTPMPKAEAAPAKKAPDDLPPVKLPEPMPQK